MKKIAIGIAAAAVLLVGCSGTDSPSGSSYTGSSGSGSDYSSNVDDEVWNVLSYSEQKDLCEFYNEYPSLANQMADSYEYGTDIKRIMREKC